MKMKKKKKIRKWTKNIHVDFYFHKTMFKSLESLNFLYFLKKFLKVML